MNIQRKCLLSCGMCANLRSAKALLGALALYVLLGDRCGCAAQVEVQPGGRVVQRRGITGAGFAVASEDGSQITLIYPNHPDDFGASAGTGTAISGDGGITWRNGPDDWPIPKSADLWMERLRDGSYVALGIQWLPSPSLTGLIQSKDAPVSPWGVGFSIDGREPWSHREALVRFPDDLGIVARPLPRLIEHADGTWLLPAYAWGSGHRTVLMESKDRGASWALYSTICTVAAIAKAGVPVTMRWLETAVCSTAGGSWVAVMRTGSSPQSPLVQCRSADAGKTWTAPEIVRAGREGKPVCGKLPGLALLPNGCLVLLTAHTKLGCRILVSTDGEGKEWSGEYVVNPQSGGNCSLLAIGTGTVLVFTPANGRIDLWRVSVSP